MWSHAWAWCPALLLRQQIYPAISLDCISLMKLAAGKRVEDSFKENDTERAHGVGGFLQ